MRDVVDYTASQKQLEPSASCTTQRTFYQLRRALRWTGMERTPAPSTRLSSISDRKGWKPRWRAVRLCAGQDDWPTEVPLTGWWLQCPETLGELALCVAAQLPCPAHPADAPWTRDEIIQTVRHVIFDQQAIWKVRLDDSFVEDLWMD